MCVPRGPMVLGICFWKQTSFARRGEWVVDKAILFFYGNSGVGKTFLRLVTGLLEETRIITEGQQY